MGATFRGHVKRNNKGVKYWTTCRVVACEPGTSFGFEVLSGKLVVNTWRYALTPAAGGTNVTESYALAVNPAMWLYWKLAGWARGRTNHNGMQTTLERIKAVVEV